MNGLCTRQWLNYTDSGVCSHIRLKNPSTTSDRVWKVRAKIALQTCVNCEHWLAIKEGYNVTEEEI